MAQTFTCYGCSGESTYKKRSTGTVLYLDTLPFRGNASDEARTYDCVHCGRENRVELNANEWFVVDLEMSDDGS